MGRNIYLEREGGRHTSLRTDRKPLFLAGAVAGLTGALLLGGRSYAQTDPAPADFTTASQIDHVEAVSLNADGSVDLSLSNGHVVRIDASDVRVVDGEVYIADDAVAEASLTASEAAAGGGGAGAGGASLGVLGGLGLAGAAAGGGGGGGGGGITPPTPTPPPPPSNANAPAFTSATTASFAENGTGVAYTAVASDADNDTVTFSIAGGADASLFSIDSASGAVSFVASPDFEAAQDSGADNVYELIIRASDGTNTTDLTVSITVTDVNEAPEITSASTVELAENQTTVLTVTVSDPEGGSITFSLSGADADLFQIDASSGALVFRSAPDFEAPADAGADNVYDVIVTANDGDNSVEQAISITVTDENESAPQITSATSVSAAENQTAAYAIEASDADGTASLTYSISGVDSGLFSVDAATGVVTFQTAPDFENPSDAGSDNVYNLTVSVSDGINTDSQSVAITVTDVAEGAAPAFASAPSSTVSENQTSAYVAVANPGAGSTGTITYSIAGTDAALFNVNAESGEVTFKAAPDFESPGDAGSDNVYNLVVTATDSGVSTDLAVAVTVSDATETGDVPQTSATTLAMLPGGAYTGTIDTDGDRDWIAITLEAGQTYRFNADGSGTDALIDPLLRLYDESGTLIKSNDDVVPGVERNSTIVFTAPSSGTFYLSVGAWEEGTTPITGEYTLSTAIDDGVFTNDEVANYLLRNGFDGGVGWDLSGGRTITVNLTALTADGISLAREALQSWADLTGITFEEVTTTAQITFDDDEEGAFAQVTTQSGFITSVDVNVSEQWLTDNSTRIDGYSYQTYLHEIGHALGLGHGGPYNSTADYGQDAIFLNDSWQSTIMSYFDQAENTWTTASAAFVVSPQVADILAMANLYGLSTTTRLGDTVYGFNSNADRTIYDATALTRQTSYVIFDSGGNDTMDYSGSNANQVLNLNAESYSSLQGATGNVSIARGTVIENAIGGNGNDTLIGNDVDNILTGNTGDDAFYSSGGNDTFDGGTGSDIAYFSGNATDYSVSTNGSGQTVVTDLRAGSPDGVTTLISIESIVYGQTYSPAQGLSAPESASAGISYFDNGYYTTALGIEIHEHHKGEDGQRHDGHDPHDDERRSESLFLFNFASDEPSGLLFPRDLINPEFFADDFAASSTRSTTSAMGASKVFVEHVMEAAPTFSAGELTDTRGLDDTFTLLSTTDDRVSHLFDQSLSVEEPTRDYIWVEELPIVVHGHGGDTNLTPADDMVFDIEESGITAVMVPHDSVEGW